MHTHSMVPHMSTVEMGMLPSQTPEGMTMGMQSSVGTHGIMQQTNMAMHQANNDDFDQFEDIIGPVPKREGTSNFRF